MGSEIRREISRSEWTPDEELLKLQCERVLAPEKTNLELAREILTTAAPMAAQSVAFLSTHAANENIRLKASQYIIDGVVGGAWRGEGDIDDMLMALVAKLGENDHAGD